ncbi:MAG: hypothetical protein KY445_02165 [Armatimonadetes bacterium]|nr:hypothetical protein [Armatimonadota bacterium]
MTETFARPLDIVTPLGTIASGATVDGFALTSQNSTHFYTLESGGLAVRWELSNGVAEMIMARPFLIPQYRQQITNCWAVLWRFKVFSPISQLVFKSAWLEQYKWHQGMAPNSGQWLDAQTWSDGEFEVSVGTEGDDALFARSEANKWLPVRFTKEAKDQEFLSLVRYLDEGLAVDFGNVFPKEAFQAHFAVAWAPYDQDSIGTWLAVDLSADRIIEGAVGGIE